MARNVTLVGAPALLNQLATAINMTNRSVLRLHDADAHADVFGYNMYSSFDYILVDSQPGISDVDLCTKLRESAVVQMENLVVASVYYPIENSELTQRFEDTHNQYTVDTHLGLSPDSKTTTNDLIMDAVERVITDRRMCAASDVRQKTTEFPAFQATVDTWGVVDATVIAPPA